MDAGASIPRCAVVWLVVTASVAGLLACLAGDVVRTVGLISSGRLAAAPFDQLLALLAALALVACGLWFWLVTTLITVEAALGGTAHTVATGPGQLSRGASAAAVGSLRTGLGVRSRDAGNGGRRSSTCSVARCSHAGRASPSGPGHRRRGTGDARRHRHRRRGTTPPNACGAPQTRRLTRPGRYGCGPATRCGAWPRRRCPPMPATQTSPRPAERSTTATGVSSAATPT